MASAASCAAESTISRCSVSGSRSPTRRHLSLPAIASPSMFPRWPGSSARSPMPKSVSEALSGLASCSRTTRQRRWMSRRRRAQQATAAGCRAPASAIRARLVRTIFGGGPVRRRHMAKLIYIANASLDGYCEDRDGSIDFGVPDEEYFGFINEIERTVGIYLYGRRMYEAMIYWETAPISDQPSWVVDFANIWRAADKFVYSQTLASVASARTTLEREFNVEAIRQMKADTTSDLTVGGSDLAAQALAAGLVDECHLF